MKEEREWEEKSKCEMKKKIQFSLCILGEEERENDRIMSCAIEMERAQGGILIKYFFVSFPFSFSLCSFSLNLTIDASFFFVYGVLAQGL